MCQSWAGILGNDPYDMMNFLSQVCVFWICLQTHGLEIQDEA
jgi:hypothetical protein